MPMRPPSPTSAALSSVTCHSPSLTSGTGHRTIAEAAQFYRPWSTQCLATKLKKRATIRAITSITLTRCPPLPSIPNGEQPLKLPLILCRKVFYRGHACLLLSLISQALAYLSINPSTHQLPNDPCLYNQEF